MKKAIRKFKELQLDADYANEDIKFQFYYDIRHSEDFRKRFYKLPDFSQE